MIAILDSGVGNPISIANMFRKIGVDATLETSAAVLRSADGIVIPGVGAFDAGIRALWDLGVVDALHDAALERKVPTLGVCLGLQLMGVSSEEGTEGGLGWLDLSAVRFRWADRTTTQPIPHMGWQEVEVTAEEPLLKDVGDPPRFYFAHSYHVSCDDSTLVTARAHYGYSFPCIVRKANISGVQFHPEKSHRYGMRFLSNFAREVEHCHRA